MARKRLLLLLKPLDEATFSNALSPKTNPQFFSFLNNRSKVHKDAINLCQDIVGKKLVDWESVLRHNLVHPIRNVDLVISLGGDGTLLQASHFMDESVPILGVNSDPTQVKEMEELGGRFDATRSTGWLCAANVINFERILDNILAGQTVPSELNRISIRINSQLLPTHALNDVLIAHPCPATASWFSFGIKKGDKFSSPLTSCRSSGLRISTAAGSTAAMLSAGGFPMPVLSRDLQYMVREPISLGAAKSCLMHGLVYPNQSMNVTWFSKKGVVYIDGSHVSYNLQQGDMVEVSSNAPVLKAFLPQQYVEV